MYYLSSFESAFSSHKLKQTEFYTYKQFMELSPYMYIFCTSYDVYYRYLCKISLEHSVGIFSKCTYLHDVLWISIEKCTQMLRYNILIGTYVRPLTLENSTVKRNLQITPRKARSLGEKGLHLGSIFKQKSVISNY